MPEMPSPDDALASARTRDAQARDPVRWSLAEALARRASAHAGEARRVIDERVAAIMQALTESPEVVVAVKPAVPSTGRDALAALVAHAARQRVAAPAAAPLPAPGAASQRPAAPRPAVAGAAADARTVQFFKRTWSRLSADQRLAQSRAALPDNAGPLNSQHLVHRALLLMRELSPEYLEHFVGYVDALQWVELANEATAQEAATAGRPAPARRSMAARRG